MLDSPPACAPCTRGTRKRRRVLEQHGTPEPTCAHCPPRHLCKDNCFFEAYEPARRLMALRLACVEAKQPLPQGWRALWAVDSVRFVAPDGTDCATTADALAYANVTGLNARGVERAAHRASDAAVAECVQACAADESTRGDETALADGASPFGLLEELWAHDDQPPWRLLVTCLLLNQTRRRCVDAVAAELFRAFPTAQSLVDADDGVEARLAALLHPVGMQRKRAVTLRQLALALTRPPWTAARDDDPPVLWRDRVAALRSLPGVGPYAVDAYTLFAEKRTDPADARAGGGRAIREHDHALRWYRAWRAHVERLDEV